MVLAGPGPVDKSEGFEGQAGPRRAEKSGGFGALDWPTASQFWKALALLGRAVFAGSTRRDLTRGEESEEGGERALLRQGGREEPLHFSMFFGGLKIDAKM